MKTLLLNPHSKTDIEKWPHITSMYDANDPGNTRGDVEVFIDRLEENLSDFDESSEEYALIDAELNQLQSSGYEAVRVEA